MSDIVDLLLFCPMCNERHIDEGSFATKPHPTHACQNCGFCWRPGVVPTRGVRFLPGFRDTDIREVQAPSPPSPPPRSTSLHDLKTWPEAFAAIEQGHKRHEIRPYDRNFGVGDLLQLREWDPSLEKYTGREQTVRVTYLSLGGTFGLPFDLCVMSLERRSSVKISS